MPTANNRFVITARCVIKDPAERARRLARAFAVLEQHRQKTAVTGDVSEAQPMTAAVAGPSKKPDSR